MSTSEDSKIITVKLRISPDLRDRIAESAKAHNRSMNADMVARLEASFTGVTQPPLQADERTQEEVRQAIMEAITRAIAMVEDVPGANRERNYLNLAKRHGKYK